MYIIRVNADARKGNNLFITTVFFRATIDTRSSLAVDQILSIAVTSIIYDIFFKLRHLYDVH